VRVRSLRNLNGVEGEAQAVLSVPKPPPPARDTTRVRRDSTKP